MWKQLSIVKLCTWIILHSEAQTCRKTTHLWLEGDSHYLLMPGFKNANLSSVFYLSLQTHFESQHQKLYISAIWEFYQSCESTNLFLKYHRDINRLTHIEGLQTLSYCTWMPHHVVLPEAPPHLMHLSIVPCLWRCPRSMRAMMSTRACVRDRRLICSQLVLWSL